MKKINHGFTLVELLVVVSIIALLSSIMFVSLATSRDKAKDAAIKEDLIGLRSSAEIYFTDNGNSYGPAFAAACPVDEVSGGSMFHRDGVSVAKSIYDAIKHARSLSNSFAALCLSRPASYVVVVQLNEINLSSTYPLRYFCVDSSGNGRVLGTDSNGLPLVYNGSDPPTAILMCNLSSTGSL